MARNEIKPGTLYVVATPIGNLDDITIRALKVLAGVDWIAAEDTRRTRKLLNRHGIKNDLISFSPDMERRKTNALVEKLESGTSGAIVSDAGTPGASDPGGNLVSEAVRRGVAVSPIPGASAIAASFSVSGLASSRFVFEGFLPRKGAKRAALLESLEKDAGPIMFFEAARRLEATLAEIFLLWGERRVVLFRELTKINEEITRASLKNVAEKKIGINEKGEYTVLIEGKCKPDAPGSTISMDADSVAREIARLDASPRNLASALAALTGVSKNQAYKKLESIRKQIRDD